jgi:hypothetical protein
MNNHGNGTHATITPPNRTGILSNRRHTSNEPTPGKGPDPNAAKKKQKLDARLEPIRDAIESQPKALQATLSDTAITMLLATRKLREKRAGLVNLTTNPDLYPRSANLLVKLDYPKELKDDEQTLENVKEWTDYIKHTKDELKKRIVKQGERTAEFFQEQRLKTFFKLILVISEGLTTWHGEIEGATELPLSTHAYGAASVYVFFNTLGPCNELFSYLCEPQETILREFKNTYLTTASGKRLFSDKQLQELSMLLPDPPEIILPPPPSSPLRLAPDDGDGSSTQVGPPTRAPERLTTQPVQEEAITPGTAPEADLTHPVPDRMELVIYKVKDVFFDLVPPLFLELARSVDASQAEKKADAKLEAALKQTKTIDMAKLLEADLANQQTVAPENMAALVNSLVDQRISAQAKKTKKGLLQTIRKKSLGGAKAAKTPPGKPNNGGKPNGPSKSNKRVAFVASDRPPTKRAKKHSTQNPNEDYNRLRAQRATPNPYTSRQRTPNHNNQRYPTNSPGRETSYRGSGRGRGRGRNQGRGDSNNGRGRGRGRY